MCATYRPPSQNHKYLFDNTDKDLYVYSTYERVVLAGDFNARVGEKFFDTFLNRHEFSYIKKNPTCYKNINNLSCIDNVLTNSPKKLFNKISDFHKLVLSVFSLHFSKAKAKDTSHWSFDNFKEDNFNRDLQNRLPAEYVEEYAPFENSFLDLLNEHAPLKKWFF